MLEINAGAYSFEAGNVRHEHEWAVWQDTKLPDDKLILPGVVSHATNVVEHPELVAERIGRFAKLVGRERVIASTDCGLGGRVHRDIAWAKLETLAQGAAIASKQLFVAGSARLRRRLHHTLMSAPERALRSYEPKKRLRHLAQLGALDLEAVGRGRLGEVVDREDAHRHLVVGEPVPAVGDGGGLVERRRPAPA